jgi:hypothetical protein
MSPDRLRSIPCRHSLACIAGTKHARQYFSQTQDDGHSTDLRPCHFSWAEQERFRNPMGLMAFPLQCALQDKAQFLDR